MVLSILSVCEGVEIWVVSERSVCLLGEEPVISS
jgi:hypothetical protein